jgi:hypothetical protein
MSGGMDQYLAKSLTQHRQYQVVADPKAADAIFTDRLGETFEKKLLELYPPPPPPPAEKPAEKLEKDASDKDKEMSIKEEPNLRMGGFSRNRGNVFLVDRASKKVLWSFYKRPKSTTPDDMHEIANAIVSELKRDVVGKKSK